MIIGERTASEKPLAPRRNGRQSGKEMQIAAVSAPEMTLWKRAQYRRCQKWPLLL